MATGRSRSSLGRLATHMWPVRASPTARIAQMQLVRIALAIAVLTAPGLVAAQQRQPQTKAPPRPPVIIQDRSIFGPPPVPHERNYYGPGPGIQQPMERVPLP